MRSNFPRLLLVHEWHKLVVTAFPWSMFLLLTMFEWIVSFGMVFGPVLGYIPQYQEIKQTGNTEAFSTLVCLILLTANILRLYFWFGKRFEMALLFQSLVMIAAQLALLHLIVTIRERRKRSRPTGLPSAEPEYSGLYILFDRSSFWAWPKFLDYCSFMIFFAVVVSLVMLTSIMLGGSATFTELIGFFSLMIESTLAMPQLYNNWRRRSVSGLRMELVLSWFVGDLFKTLFFIFRQSPIQFILCGFIQLAVDTAIFVQMRIYGKSDSSIALPQDTHRFAQFEPSSGHSGKRQTTLRF